MKRPLRRLLERRACISYSLDAKKESYVNNDADILRVLFLGDTGSGSDDQLRVAEASDRVCRERGCDLAILLGDNFIQNGISGIYDEQLQTKFEKVYRQDIPFYAILGNHDLEGDWRAQIDYTLHSKRWNMPGTDYSFQAGPVSFRAVNTACTLKSLWNLFRKSKKTWTVVLGHHPVLSSGRHGGMTSLERWIIKRSGIRFFISGHNHVLEHVECKSFDQIISGGGGSSIEHSKRKRLSETRFFEEDFGFVWAEFRTTIVEFRFFDIIGQEIYSFERRCS